MKAIALISGGLDSILAAKLIREQGIEVVALYFRIPFCLKPKKAGDDNQSNPLKKRAESLGLAYRRVRLDEEFLEIVSKPRYGYGSNLNPCLDCKILMLRKSALFMRSLGAEFVITGEVLGQRPMSQHKRALELIEKKSGLEGLVLRPLSARLLSETIPEKKGWVNREKLYAFSGRRRKPQMELAKAFNISDYPTPAGGCLLTDPEFSRKVRDLIEHASFNLDDIELLKIGRHFRVSHNSKLVVGRNEQENTELIKLSHEGDYLFMPDDNLAGPTSLGRGSFDKKLIELSCSITSRYCDLNGARLAGIVYRALSEGEAELIEAPPLPDGELGNFRI